MRSASSSRASPKARTCSACIWRRCCKELDVTSCLPPDEFDALVLELRKVLRPAGAGASLLWRSVMPRVPEALARFQAMGKKLVIVSNSDGTVERSITEAGLRPFFAVVVDSAIAGYEKPDPRIFAHALEASGATPERTLHVGDIYHADVTGARGAGVHVVMLDPFNDWSIRRLRARARRVGRRRSVGTAEGTSGQRTSDAMRPTYRSYLHLVLRLLRCCCRAS